MSVLEQLGEFAATARIADRSAEDQALQRRHITDAVAGIVAGRRTEEAGTLDAVLADRPMGLMAASVRLSEIDDIHCTSCTTPSSATVPAALMAIAWDENADASRFADAVWVGTELLSRLGVAIDGARVLYRGVWPTYFAAPMGIAATVGRLLGLDETRMTYALAMALNMTAGGVSRNDAPRAPRWLLFASAVENGALAARGALHGFGGDGSLLDSPDWLERTHGITFNPKAMTDGLDGETIYSKLSIKPFCSAKQAIAATDAMRRLAADGLDPAAIESVEVRVPPAYLGMISRKPAAGNRSSTMVSVAYQIGLALNRPDCLYDIDRKSVPFDGPAMDLCNKVEVVADESLASAFPARFPAAVTVKAGGKTYEQRVEDAEGDPGNRLDDAALGAKLHGVLDPLVGAGEAKKWIDAARAALGDAAAAKDLAARVSRL